MQTPTTRGAPIGSTFTPSATPASMLTTTLALDGTGGGSGLGTSIADTLAIAGGSA